MELDAADLAMLDTMVKNMKAKSGVMVSPKVLAKALGSIPGKNVSYFKKFSDVFDQDFFVVLS